MLVIFMWEIFWDPHVSMKIWFLCRQSNLDLNSNNQSYQVKAVIGIEKIDAGVSFQLQIYKYESSN